MPVLILHARGRVGMQPWRGRHKIRLRTCALVIASASIMALSVIAYSGVLATHSNNSTDVRTASIPPCHNCVGLDTGQSCFTQNSADEASALIQSSLSGVSSYGSYGEVSPFTFDYPSGNCAGVDLAPGGICAVAGGAVGPGVPCESNANSQSGEGAAMYEIAAEVSTSFTFPGTVSGGYPYSFTGSADSDLQIEVGVCDDGQSYSYAASGYVNMTMSLYSGTTLLQSTTTNLIDLGYTTWSGGANTLDQCIGPTLEFEGSMLSVGNSYGFSYDHQYTVLMSLTFTGNAWKYSTAAAPCPNGLPCSILDDVSTSLELFNPGLVNFGYISYEYET